MMKAKILLGACLILTPIATSADQPQGLSAPLTLGAILDNRSPGIRADGARSNKFAIIRHEIVDTEPQPASVIPSDIPPTITEGSGGMGPMIPIDELPNGVPVLVQSNFPLSNGGFFSPTGGPIPSVPGIAGGGGGGGIFIPPTPDNPSNPTNPTSPVPEPASWVMMILGIGICGWFLRRKKNLHSVRI